MADRDERPEKKGFWGALFRGKSLATRPGHNDPEPPTAGHGETLSRRRRVSLSDGALSVPPPGARRRPRRRSDADGAKRGDRPGKLRDRRNSSTGDGHAHSTQRRPPLNSWPPSNLGSQEELSLGQAMDLISNGVPAHRGHRRSIPHAPDHYYALYTTTAGNTGDDNTDAVNLHDSMTQFMTLRIQGSGSGRSSDPAAYPWDSLEQPSHAFYYGRIPGTVTLNQWAFTSSNWPPPLALRDSGVLPRDVDLPRIFERIRELESPRVVEENEERMYRALYRLFLRDPDREAGRAPHRALDRQITDLILVLSRPGYWIDFSEPRNQVVTRFLFDAGEDDGSGSGRGGGDVEERFSRFCHQLLLSAELEVRIQAKSHGEWAKEKLLAQLPPTIRWDLALAKRWRENVRVEAWGKKHRDVKLRYKLRRRQMRMLKRFAQVMKWPNLGEAVSRMKERDAEGSLDQVSSDAMAFFSGLILPGSTFPFLIMNTLIDIDPDPTTNALALLTHIHPHCGFQHRSSYTYWSAACIVGKVLAPTCHALAGWVGPARPSPDLRRSQIARVRSRRPAARKALSPEDALSMSERSDPLGPAEESYPVADYELVGPKFRERGIYFDGVRIEMLGFKAVRGGGRPSAGGGGDMGVGGSDGFGGGAGASGSGSGKTDEEEPGWYDATVQFAIDGVSWPLRLAYDVSFVSAWPCEGGGPHPLFFDYVFETVRADQVVEVKDWGGVYYGSGGGSASASGRGSFGRSSTPGQTPNNNEGREDQNQDAEVGEDEDEAEKVLVIEAFGAPDNEVLARAWCSHWGLSGVVADVRKTCVACAVREAYAATLTVVILMDGERDKGERED